MKKLNQKLISIAMRWEIMYDAVFLLTVSYAGVPKYVGS